MFEYILSAFVFGLTAGLHPGPLGIVIIQQTLQHGLKSGLKASLAPIITDIPIILVVVIIFSQLQSVEILIAALSTVGGMYLLYLSSKLLRFQKIKKEHSSQKEKSLSIAIRVSLLSPYPYLFWFTVGGTYLALGTTSESLAFVIVFTGILVLSKMLLAWFASRFNHILSHAIYVKTMRVLGAFMFVFGIFLFYTAYDLLL